MQSLDNALATPLREPPPAWPAAAATLGDGGGTAVLIFQAARGSLVLRAAPPTTTPAAGDVVVSFDAAAVAARVAELAGDDRGSDAVARSALRLGVREADGDEARGALAEIPVFLLAPGAPDPDAPAGHTALSADILQRAVARLLLVCAGADAGRMERRDGQVAVDRACGFMTAHIDEPLALADIARAARTSARTLQYGFVSRFGMSPMRWLREQRLRRLHAALREAPEGRGVTELAVGLGFTHLGRLGRLFQRRFGVLPKHLLRRTRSG